MELAERSFAGNVVAPCPAKTPMMVDPRRADVPLQIPSLGAPMEPKDIAALEGFLAGKNGDSITGEVPAVCGGASLTG